MTDLQPLEVLTRVEAETGGAARARFTLTNPGRVGEAGELVVRGPGATGVWDETALVWRVEVTEGAETREIRQALRLGPLDQARVWVARPRGAAKSHADAVAVAWRSGGVEQSAWWRVTGEAERGARLRNDNLALNNPFYAVPLHHARAEGMRTAGDLNLRARASIPCRIELVREADGRVLAVDAQGDGAFDREGDVVLQDRDRDGFPDLPGFGEDGGVELYVYASEAAADVAVELEARSGSEPWRRQTSDLLLKEE